MLFYSTICRWLFLFFQKCVKDTLSPIIIKLNFSQDDNGGKSGILNVDSKRQAVVEVCTTEGCWQSHKCASCLDKEKHQSCAQYKAHILRCEMEFCFMDVMMTFLNLSFFKLWFEKLYCLSIVCQRTHALFMPFLFWFALYF